MTWGKRKDGQAYQKDKSKGMSGTKMPTDATSDIHMKEHEVSLNTSRVLRIMNETDRRLQGLSNQEQFENYDRVFREVEDEILSEKPNEKCIDCGNKVPKGNARCESCFNVWLNTTRRIRNDPNEHMKLSNKSTSDVHLKTNQEDDLIIYSHGVRLDKSRENHVNDIISEVAVTPERINLEITNLGIRGTRFTLGNEMESWSMDVAVLPVFTQQDSGRVQRIIDEYYRNLIGVNGFKTIRDKEKFRDLLETKLKREFNDIPIDEL